MQKEKTKRGRRRNHREIYSVRHCWREYQESKRRDEGRPLGSETRFSFRKSRIRERSGLLEHI
jgi:hypothetical protein